MAFGKYTNDYNVRSRASSLSAVDEGLRKFMLRVYGYMSAGLAITGVISYLFANAYVSGNALVMSLDARTPCICSYVCSFRNHFVDEFWY